MMKVKHLDGLTFIQKIGYVIVYALLYVMSLLPMCMLYLISDAIYVLVYYLIGYRRAMVRKNLKDSFPDKTDAERNNIGKQFFHFLCDYIVETVKLVSISPKEMAERMRFENLDIVEDALKKSRPVTLYLGHYCNWEWVSSLSLYSPKGYINHQIYHPLENKVMDRIFYNIRGRFGHVNINLDETFPTLLKCKKAGQLTMTGYISDQVPGYSSMHYWPMFLNHKTPTYSGAERIARILDTTVLYLDIFRPKRGYYVGKFVLMSEYPNKEPKFSITDKYYKLLEKSIQNNPQYWLWSHNRWKRKWEDFCEYYPEEKERERILSKL